MGTNFQFPWISSDPYPSNFELTAFGVHIIPENSYKRPNPPKNENLILEIRAWLS